MTTFDKDFKMRLSNYKESSRKQEAGSPCYVEEAHFDVKRIGTPEYSKQIDEITKKEYGFAPKDVDNNLIIAVWLCEYGVTGWDGVIGEDDKELAYNKRNARKVFMNPDYFMSLNLLLIQHAGNYNNYLYDDLLVDIENVKKS